MPRMKQLKKTAHELTEYLQGENVLGKRKHKEKAKKELVKTHDEMDKLKAKKNKEAYKVETILRKSKEYNKRKKKRMK